MILRYRFLVMRSLVLVLLPLFRFFIILISWFFLPKMTLLIAEVGVRWLGLLFNGFLMCDSVWIRESLDFIRIFAKTLGIGFSRKPPNLILSSLKISRPCPSVFWVRIRRMLKPKKQFIKKDNCKENFWCTFYEC